MRSPESFVVLTTRLAIYTGCLLAIYALLPMLVQDGDLAVFKEGGPVEWLQFQVLVVTGCVFLAGSVMFRSMRQWFIVLAMLSLTAAIRESDTLLDNLLPSVGWQFPAFLLMCVGVITICRNPGGFVRQAKVAISTRGFGMLWAGFIVVVVFAQLVGHGAFLEAAMGSDYTRSYKRMIEELGELFGYALLALGSVESLVEAPAAQRALTQQRAALTEEDDRASAGQPYGELRTTQV